MAIQQKLHTRLVQKLILTPSLQQAIKLLPMSTLELAELLNQEMVENPLLEEVPDRRASRPKRRSSRKQAEQRSPSEKDDKWDDADYEYFFGEYLDDGYRPRQPQEVKELPPIENTLSSNSSLADHLMWQLSPTADDDDAIRDVGAAIIGNIDEDGYLVASLDEIATLGAVGRSTMVERALEHVQSFDPIGVGARDLQECLLLQLRHLGARRHAGRNARRAITCGSCRTTGFPSSRASSGLEPEEIKTAHRADQASRSEARLPLQPGAIAVRHPRRLHREDRRRVHGDAERRRPAAAAHQPGLPPPARQGRRRRRTRRAPYVKDKFRSALWLLKSLDQRQNTILKVATSIINFQRDFLDHGIEHLRPLVLRDVANDIGMHESTVSPRGEQQVHAHAAGRVSR